MCISILDYFWDHFRASTMLLGAQMTEFHMYEYLPFLPIASYVSSFRSFANLASHTLRRWCSRDYHNRSLGRTDFFRTVRSHLASFNMSPVCWEPCVGVRWAMPMALTGDAKQATGEGKSGPVETGLTGPVSEWILYPSEYRTPHTLFTSE